MSNKNTSDRADDPNRRLAERLHGIAGPSMAVIIGNMIHEMIFELQIRESQGCAGGIPVTLTDEERQAVSAAYGMMNERAAELQKRPDTRAAARPFIKWARALQGLFERLGGAR